MELNKIIGISTTFNNEKELLEYLFKRYSSSLEYDRRIEEYISSIKNSTFKEEDVGPLITDLMGDGICKSEDINELKGLLPMISPLICKYFNCSESEICFENCGNNGYSNAVSDGVFPYKIVFGDVDIIHSDYSSFDNLTMVFGDFRGLYLNKWESFNNLTFVGGSFDVQSSSIGSIPRLSLVFGNFSIGYTKAKYIGNLVFVGENLRVACSEIMSLNNLKYVCLGADFKKSIVHNCSNLVNVGGLSLEDSYIGGGFANLECIGDIDVDYYTMKKDDVNGALDKEPVKSLLLMISNY